MGSALFRTKELLTLVFCLSASCAEAQTRECVARLSTHTQFSSNEESMVGITFDELNASQADRVKFFRRVLESKKFNWILTCKYGPIEANTDLSRLPRKAQDWQCKGAPFVVIRSDSAQHSGAQYTSLLKTACEFEIPGVIETAKSEFWVKGRAPLLVTPGN